MKIIDEILPKVKAEVRLDKDNKTLWIKTDTLDGYGRIIVEDGSIWCRVFYEDYEDNPTSSKMEQVDKDINVRSKDEPQTEDEYLKIAHITAIGMSDGKERVMGRIAWNDGKYHRCRDCMWLTGASSSVGIECMQPDNQKKWAHQEELRKNKFYPKVVARYKAPSAKACKRYEPKLVQTDCQWK